MNRIPYLSLIVENPEGEILLVLRENRSTSLYPNQWTLIGGNMQATETPELAAHRILVEQTGLRACLSFWKRYDREHPLFTVDQHIFTGRLDLSGGAHVLGVEFQFFKPQEVRYLKIGYGFKELVCHYLLTSTGIPHVHYA